MKSVLQSWQLLLLVWAGWINRHQQRVIEYLRVENQILNEKLGKRRILLTEDRRRRLTIKEKVLDRKGLQEVAPDPASADPKPSGGRLVAIPVLNGLHYALDWPRSCRRTAF